jgi:hypothetical protein
MSHSLYLCVARWGTPDQLKSGLTGLPAACMLMGVVVACVQERLRTLMWGALSGHCRLPPLPAPTHQRPSSTIPMPAQGIAANCVVRPQQRTHGIGSSSGSDQEQEEEQQQQQEQAVDEGQPGTSAAAERWAQQARQQKAQQQAQQQRQAEQQGPRYREYGPLLPPTVLGDALGDLPPVHNFCMMDIQPYG